MRFAITAQGRHEGIAAKGLLSAHKWWLLRRASQIGALAVFMAGPMFGYWIVRGNFASSELLETVPFSDPFILLQSLFAGMEVATPALIGALIIIALYLIVGGRAYCGWICPVNIVTDFAFWLREKTGLTRDRKLDRSTRIYILLGTLAASLATGTIAWEFVNPVSTLQRGMISGIGFGWIIILAVFFLDLFVSRRAWCSHLCPVGAFYGLVGKGSLVRVAAKRREDCTNCAACFNVCPEPHIITPALRGSGTRLILSGDCLSCGACIDSCPVDVFSFTSRLSRNVDLPMTDSPSMTDSAAPENTAGSAGIKPKSVPPRPRRNRPPAAATPDASVVASSPRPVSISRRKAPVAVVSDPSLLHRAPPG